ncbi:MAG: 2TM domain-containing protein [Alphaproteobacteria bacterium]
MTETKEMAETTERTRTPSREEREAQRYVKRLKRFYMQAVGAGVLVVFLFIVNIMTSPSYLWFLWPALGFGVALAVQAVALFGLNDLFGPEWEERQMAKRLNKK